MVLQISLFSTQSAHVSLFKIKLHHNNVAVKTLFTLVTVLDTTKTPNTEAYYWAKHTGGSFGHLL